jgi:UDP-2-acetamido-2-deoxy-ribo-hexuluronate aminotransferase
MNTMRPIQMVDTKGQYVKIKTEVDAAIQEVLESSMFIGGKMVEAFRENLATYNGSKHVIPCANESRFLLKLIQKHFA